MKTQEIDEVLLQKLYFAVQQHIPDERVVNLQGVEFTSFFELLTRDLVFRISGYVWEEELEKRVLVASYPKTWWQHFKKDVMPEWFTKKFPVELKREEVLVKFTAVYPKFAEVSEQPFVRKIRTIVDFRN